MLSAFLHPVLAAVALSPSFGGTGFYRCYASAAWGDGFRAFASSFWEKDFEAGRVVHLDVRRSGNDGVPLVSATWSGMRAEVRDLSPPHSLSFSLPVPRRARGRTLLLIPAEGAPFTLPFGKGDVRYVLTTSSVYVTIQDPSLRERLTNGAKWRFAALDHSGRVVGSGDLQLPALPHVQEHFLPLAERLEAMARAPQTDCEFDPPTEE